jgi:hypothetical protein
MLMNSVGRLCGEALVMFTTPEMAIEAQQFTGKHMGTRYIEGVCVFDFFYDYHAHNCNTVFAVADRDLRARLPTILEPSCYIRIRGLPFDITDDGIYEFFDGKTCFLLVFWLRLKNDRKIVQKYDVN